MVEKVVVHPTLNPASADSSRSKPSPYAALAPVPNSVKETGLSLSLLEDLLSRLLMEVSIADLRAMTSVSALSSSVIEEIMGNFRLDGRIEIRAPEAGSSGVRYTLTDAGRKFAREAFERSGYVGPAPVSAEQYEQIIKSQSVYAGRVTRTQMVSQMGDVVIDPAVLNQLGAAMHSGKAAFIYGYAGTGKSYICNRLSRLLGEPVLVPYAVCADDTIITLFDPLIHKPVADASANNSLMMSGRHDARFQLCERPFVTSGGELSAEHLEVRYDEATRQYVAPLQLKASNGIYLIDDLGRQKIPTSELFNRWIVPMEAGIDYLNLLSGSRLVLPFDLVLIFSTNMDPKDLADAAFMRRIGHKIKLGELSPSRYKAIWKNHCEQKKVGYEEAIADYVIANLHAPNNTPLLACHPRDLINAALDFIDYSEEDRRLTTQSMDLAWNTNFVMGT